MLSDLKDMREAVDDGMERALGSCKRYGSECIICARPGVVEGWPCGARCRNARAKRKRVMLSLTLKHLSYHEWRRGL